MSAGSAVSFFGFNIIYLYECLSLVIVSCSMQVKVRCKVVWQVVPNSSIHNMWNYKKKAFSPRRNTCFFISCTRIRGFLSLNSHQNNTGRISWGVLRNIKNDSFAQAKRSILILCTRIRGFRLWNHINQNPIGTTTSNIIHDTPLITKTPRPNKGRVPS